MPRYVKVGVKHQSINRNLKITANYFDVKIFFLQNVNRIIPEILLG
jgi:hypothetical protein